MGHAAGWPGGGLVIVSKDSSIVIDAAAQGFAMVGSPQQRGRRA